MAPVPEDSPLLHLAFPQHRAGHGQGCRRTCSTSTGCPSHHGNRTQGGAGLHWQHHLVGQDRIHGGGSKPLPCQLCEVPTSLLLPSHEKGYLRSCVMYIFWCIHSVWLMSGHGHLAYIPAKIFALQVSSQGFPLLHITKIPNVFLQRLPSSSKPESGWFLIAQMCNISPHLSQYRWAQSSIQTAATLL